MRLIFSQLSYDDVHNSGLWFTEKKIAIYSCRILQRLLNQNARFLLEGQTQKDVQQHNRVIRAAKLGSLAAGEPLTSILKLSMTQALVVWPMLLLSLINEPTGSTHTRLSLQSLCRGRLR